MKNLQKGSINVWLVVIIILLVVAVGYFAFVKSPANNKLESLNSIPQTTNEVSSSNTNLTSKNESPSKIVKTYSIPACGVTVSSKINSESSVVGNSGQYTLNIDNYHFTVNCSEKSIWQNLSIQQVLGINGSGNATAVNKDSYLVFDQSTKANISQLYSEMPAPLHPGTEQIGFSKGNWYYKFYFSNPSEAKNQDTFVISVK